MFARWANDSLKPLMSDAVIVKGKNTYLRSRKAQCTGSRRRPFVFEITELSVFEITEVSIVMQ
jgi:hypothetical protein